MIATIRRVSPALRRVATPATAVMVLGGMLLTGCAGAAGTGAMARTGAGSPQPVTGQDGLARCREPSLTASQARDLAVYAATLRSIPNDVLHGTLYLQRVTVGPGSADDLPATPIPGPVLDCLIAGPAEQLRPMVAVSGLHDPRIRYSSGCDTGKGERCVSFPGRPIEGGVLISLSGIGGTGTQLTISWNVRNGIGGVGQTVQVIDRAGRWTIISDPHGYTIFN